MLLRPALVAAQAYGVFIGKGLDYGNLPRVWCTVIPLPRHATRIIEVLATLTCRTEKTAVLRCTSPSPFSLPGRALLPWLTAFVALRLPKPTEEDSSLGLMRGDEGGKHRIASHRTAPHPP